MKKSLIFLCILTVAFIAFFDAKGRIEELDEVAANTPSQVEMKQMMDKPEQQIKKHIPDVNRPPQLPENNSLINPQDPNLQKKFENVEKRRNTIQQQTN